MPLFNGVSVLVIMKGHVVTAGGAQTHDVLNGYAYLSNDAFTPTRFLNFLTAFKGNVADPVAGGLHTDYVADSLFLYGRCNSLGPPFSTGTSSNNGGIGGGRLPLSVAANVVPRTGLRGKSFIGLKRFGPLPLSHVSGDELNATGLGQWHFVAAQMTSGFTAPDGANWFPQVFSRKLSHRTLTTFTPWLERITSVDVNKTLGLARHRRERTVL